MQYRPLSVLAAVVAMLCADATSRAMAAEGWYRQPALHGDQIVFASEGDLWICRVDDEDAETPIPAYRLTNGDGEESHPVFSTDGTMIAYAAQYDGNTDVYIMPVTGGAATRLTFHPGDDIPLSWSPDGAHVFFRSARAQPNQRPELWRTHRGGGMPERMPIGECTMARFSSTGSRYVFTPWSNETWNWRGYRGGTAPDIWIADRDAETAVRLTNDPANDLFPMWLMGRVFFLSDRDGAFNLYSKRSAGTELQARTHFAEQQADPTAIEGFAMRWPSADAARRGTRIVFCQGGALALFNAEDDSIRRLNVRLTGDRAASRPRVVDGAESIDSIALSYDGAAIAIETRGELLWHDRMAGTTRQLTRSSGTRERGVTITADDALYFVTDQPGDQQIGWMQPLEGDSTPRLLTTDREAWLFPPVVAVESGLVAFGDHTMRLHILNPADLIPRLVDRSEAGEITDYRFSPDGRWLAYAKPMPNGLSSIWLYSVETTRTFPLSDGRSSDFAPRWDPSGAYLYFLSNRHLDPMMGQIDTDHVYAETTCVQAIMLAASTPPPMAAAAIRAEMDLWTWSLPELARADAAPIQVTTEGIASRRVRLPFEPGTYLALEAMPGGVLAVRGSTPTLLGDDSEYGALLAWSPLTGEVEPVAETVGGLTIAPAHTAVAWDDGEAVHVLELPIGDEPEVVDLGDLSVRVNVAEEWTQIFNEAWRLQRDFYWAPNHAGVDWEAMRTKYASRLDRIGTREELNRLIGAMIGELQSSHAYIGGGDRHAHLEADAHRVGMLGIDLEFSGGFAVITRILPRADWSPGLESPLDYPHLGVSEGSVLLAVNGEPMQFGVNLHAMLQGQAGRDVTLRVADDTARTNERVITVRAIEDETMLRYVDWVERNRAYVEAQSDGAIGYVHIPDMGGMGLSFFSRQFFPQHDRSALVIDVRNNRGGFVSQMIIERIARPLVAFAQPRYGRTFRYPEYAPHAHLVTLIDQHAGSDGDIFPSVFRAMNLGTLIGTRTWGGTIGIRGDKPFVDAGMSTQPEFAWWDWTGWALENIGVSPDIAVRLTPDDRRAGRDPQLDAAIEHLQQELQRDPKALPAVPGYPGGSR